jgi:hypothetical protein
MSNVATKDDVKGMTRTLTRRAAVMLGFAAIVIGFTALFYR